MSSTSFDPYAVGRASLAQLAANRSSSSSANINEDWVLTPATVRPTSYLYSEHLQRSAERGESPENSIERAVAVTIPDGDPEMNQNELLKGMVIEMMKGHPFLNGLLEQCVADKTVITIAQLREKVREYELSQTGFVMIDTESPTIQMVPMDEEGETNSEFADLFSTLEQLQEKSGENAIIKFPQNASYEVSFINADDIKRYCAMVVNSPLFYKSNLQRLCRAYKTVEGATKVVATGVALYYSPWLTAAYLVARVAMRALV